ncbi:DUF4189 domain-containing protein [Luteimonas mephitis]|uniref:DUF4189 domain-containing protein n=1 Tax=Luteimonas mephitis TaxID=83615 RepID=UPI003A8F4E65
MSAGGAAGAAQCGPSSLVDSNDAGYTSSTPYLPPVRWADSWGAIADDGNGQYGIVTDMPSKRSAKKAAIQECRRRGGEECTAGITYKNQCAVVVMGSTRSNVVHALTIEKAAEIAMAACHQRNDVKCRIFWSGCSHAKRVW